jgi:methylmalonyl-CoA mutase cobalamin-binding subunit
MLIMLRSDSETQYKRQFGIWNLKRALSTTKKEKITAALETRAQQGKLSVVRHQGKVEIQKIRRYMKEQTRRDISIRTSISSEPVDVENLFGHDLQCGNRV